MTAAELRTATIRPSSTRLPPASRVMTSTCTAKCISPRTRRRRHQPGRKIRTGCLDPDRATYLRDGLGVLMAKNFRLDDSSCPGPDTSSLRCANSDLRRSRSPQEPSSPQKQSAHKRSQARARQHGGASRRRFRGFTHDRALSTDQQSAVPSATATEIPVESACLTLDYGQGSIVRCR